MLPTEKTPSDLTFANAKVLLYGPPKTGKSTLCAGLDADKTLFLATEPGLGGLEVFQVPIATWDDFRVTVADLRKGEHEFTTIVIDTVDELYRWATMATLSDLGIDDPGDLEWGKGWRAVGNRFRMGIGALAATGCGLWFISHSKTEEIKQRIGTTTKYVPTISGAGRDFLVGFCDYIFFAVTETTPEEGERRVLRTAATENYEAGGRTTLPDPLPLQAAAVQQALGPKREAKKDGDDTANAGVVAAGGRGTRAERTAA